MLELAKNAVHNILCGIEKYFCSFSGFHSLWALKERHFHLHMRSGYEHSVIQSDLASRQWSANQLHLPQDCKINTLKLLYHPNAS